MTTRAADFTRPVGRLTGSVVLVIDGRGPSRRETYAVVLRAWRYRGGGLHAQLRVSWCGTERTVRVHRAAWLTVDGRATCVGVEVAVDPYAPQPPSTPEERAAFVERQRAVLAALDAAGDGERA